MIWMLAVRETKGSGMTARFWPFPEIGKMAVDTRECRQSEVWL